MLPIMFHLNVAIVFALLHVLMVILQTSLEKLFVSVLVEIVNGIPTELHIPKQFNVQHRRHPCLLSRKKKRQQLQRQAQRLQQHLQQQLRQQLRDVNINKVNIILTSEFGLERISALRRSKICDRFQKL